MAFYMCRCGVKKLLIDATTIVRRLNCMGIMHDCWQCVDEAASSGDSACCDDDDDLSDEQVLDATCNIVTMTNSLAQRRRSHDVATAGPYSASPCRSSPDPNQHRSHKAGS